MKFFRLLSAGLLIVFLSIIQVDSQQLAFPGAEGFGRYVTGGRGGTVYHVTNLNDNGPGSFRDAVSQSNRIVVFDVGGVINITSRIVIYKNITVAGQTAPGDGITIYGNGIAFNSSSGNDIIRYIRIRMGASGDKGKDAIGISDGQNYIFDHVSVSWGRDGTFDINGSYIDNVTIQDCIIGQGVNVDNHSTGGLMQSGKLSIIRTLFIDNKTRNPKGRERQEYINNIVYNWASDGYILGGSTSATSPIAWANIIGCYFISGPSTTGNAFTSGTGYFTAYVSDNYFDNNKDGILNGNLVPNTSSSYAGATLVTSPFDYPGVNKLLTATEAYYHVAQNAGASMVRDEVDKYLINELLSLGKNGAIITRESDNGIAGNVGVVNNGTPPVDSDRDGMADEWEVANGLDPTNKEDSKGDIDGDGYTNIEEYLNSLIVPPPPLKPPQSLRGEIVAEWYNDMPGKLVSDLAKNVNFPTNPYKKDTLEKFESFENVSNSFGTRIRGYLYPPVPGQYTFYISADEEGILYLSTDSTISNAKLIAKTNRPTTKYEWEKDASQISEKITLVDNLKYYIEVQHKDDMGDDHIEVAWEGPGLTRQIIDGKYLSTWGDTLNLLGVPLSVEDKEMVTYEIYPNPAHDEFIIELPGKINEGYELQLYNSLGKLLFTKTVKDNRCIVEISNLQPGLYMVKLNNGKQAYSYKLMKE